MGLKVTWVVQCDGCGLIKTTTKSPENDLEETDNYFDVWGPGIPGGWIQMPFDKTTNRRFLFFHNEICLINWLTLQGRNEDAESIKEGVWFA